MNFTQYIFVDCAGDVFMANPSHSLEMIFLVAKNLGYRPIPLREWLERNNGSPRVDSKSEEQGNEAKLVLTEVSRTLFSMRILRDIFVDLGLEVVKISLRGSRGAEEPCSAEVTVGSPEQARTALRSADWLQSIGITLTAA